MLIQIQRSSALDPAVWSLTKVSDTSPEVLRLSSARGTMHFTVKESKSQQNQQSYRVDGRRTAES